jgi:hypothetical protein
VHPPERHEDEVARDDKRNLRESKLELYFTLSSLALSICCFIVGSSHPVLAGSLLIVALCFSAYSARKRAKPNNNPLRFFPVYLFVLQFTVIPVTIAHVLFIGPYSTTDPVTLILLLAFGLIGFGLALFVGVTYLPKWPYAEPLALGIVAIVLGGMCLPGLRVFTRPLDFPSTDGIALLFATGPADQKLYLRVRLLGLNIPATFQEPISEEFHISTSEGSSVNWALLVAGDAQLTKSTVDWDSSHNIRYKIFKGQTAEGDYSGTLELFSGTVSNKSPTWVDGDVDTDYVNRVTDHSAALLPDYGQGYATTNCPGGRDADDCLAGLTSGPTAEAVTRALGGRPTRRSLNAFVVNVDGGVFWPDDSIENSRPQPLTKRPEPNFVRWSEAGNIQVSYNTVAKSITNDTTGILFVFAILLGVAGAGILGAIQATVHILISSKSSSEP